MATPGGGQTAQRKGVDPGAGAIVWGERKKGRSQLEKRHLRRAICAGLGPNRSQEAEVRPAARGPATGDVCPQLFRLNTINVCHLSVIQAVGALFIAAPGMFSPGVNGCVVRQVPTT